PAMLPAPMNPIFFIVRGTIACDAAERRSGPCCRRGGPVVAPIVGSMRRAVAVGVGALVGVLAACVPPRSGPTPTLAQEPSSAWTVVARHPSPLSTLARTRPELADLVLYLEAREAARSGDDATALDRIAALQE